MSDDKPTPTYADDTVLCITFGDGSTEQFKVLTSVFQGKGQEVVISHNCTELGSTVLYRDSGQKNWYAWKLHKDCGTVTLTIVGAPDEPQVRRQSTRPKGRIRRDAVSE